MMKTIVDGTCDFLNFYKYPSDMPTAGKYDIPVIKAIKIKHPERYQLIAFDEAHLIPKSQRKRYIVHFFVYDYKFERVWTYLKKYTEYLGQFAAVIAPDFSQYTDMPRAMCIWNTYRAQFVAWWWQNAGLKVIPNACWSDRRSFKYCFDGQPSGGVIAVSSKGCVFDDKKSSQQPSDAFRATESKFRAGFKAMLEKLQPSQILWLGSKPVWLADISDDIEIITISSRKLYQERLDKLNNKTADLSA